MKALGKGKEEEGTEPVLADTGLLSAFDLETTPPQELLKDNEFSVASDFLCRNVRC